MNKLHKKTTIKIDKDTYWELQKIKVEMRISSWDSFLRKLVEIVENVSR